MSAVATRKVFAFALLVSCALFSCAKSRTVENSSETHFLARCEGGCGAGLDCICGVCTQACTEARSCVQLSSQASCVEPEGESCGAERTCDLECERDADCAALGDRTCAAGRCREPRTSVADGGAPDSGASDAGGAPQAPPTCDTAGLSALFDAGSPVFCPPARFDAGVDAGVDGGALDEALEQTRACVETAMAEGRAFLVYSTQVGTDSLYGGGYLGVREGGAWTVYDLGYDDFGIGIDMGTGPGFEPLWWTPCLEFSVNATCEEGCFECETRREDACGCAPGQDGAPPTVRCLAPDFPPCAELSCELDGACYSPYDFFADTFYTCICDEDGQHCEGNGEDRNGLGRRCEVDRDCTPAHTCRTDFAGSPGVCSRPCGPGCPHDVECVDVPSASSGTVEDMCLRTCDPSAEDCREYDLGSDCVTLEGVAKTFCL
jgi:hypothetical protein